MWSKFSAYIVPAEILYLISLLAFVDIIPDKLQNSFISHVKSVPTCRKNANGPWHKWFRIQLLGVKLVSVTAHRDLLCVIYQRIVNLGVCWYSLVYSKRWMQIQE